MPRSLTIFIFGGGGILKLYFRIGVFCRIWTKFSTTSAGSCITDSLSHTTYVETKKDSHRKCNQMTWVVVGTHSSVQKGVHTANLVHPGNSTNRQESVQRDHQALNMTPPPLSIANTAKCSECLMQTSNVRTDRLPIFTTFSCQSFCPHLVVATKTHTVDKWAARILLECCLDIVFIM